MKTPGERFFEKLKFKIEFIDSLFEKEFGKKARKISEQTNNFISIQGVKFCYKEKDAIIEWNFIL